MATTTKDRPDGRGRGRKGRFRLRWEYAVLVLALAFFAYKFLEKTQQIQQWQQQRAALQYENQQTAADNARVRRDIRYYRTSGYVEDAGRAELGFVRPGEIAIQPSVHHPPVAKVQKAPVMLPAPPPPTWQQWWHAFFG